MAENRLDNGNSLLQGLASNLVSNVEGIFSAKPMAKYLSGARCVLRVNGKIIGFAFAISWEIKTAVTEINTIDDYLPYELAPSRIEVTGAISGFRIPGSGPSLTLIQTDIASFMHQRYIDIEVRDSQTDNLIFLANKAMITNRTENIKIDQLADMTLSFKAIGWADERAPKEVDGIGDPVDVDGTSSLGKLTDKVKNLF
jgi:hypothetical protein